MKIYNMKYTFGILLLITITHAEKEPHEETPSKLNSTDGATNKTDTSVTIKKPELVAEGGLRKNLVTSRINGREGYTPVPVPSSPKDVIIPVNELPSTINSATTPTPIINETVKSDHKTIARKGAVLNVTQTMNANSTAAPVPKKPTVTVPGTEAPSHFESPGKSNSSSKPTPKVPNFDIMNGIQDNTQKYVVPIVIVILSVPFVAILISIVYKRGSEWWKYRHYRRMDFLINGIYDN